MKKASFMGYSRCLLILWVLFFFFLFGIQKLDDLESQAENVLIVFYTVCVWWLYSFSAAVVKEADDNSWPPPISRDNTCGPEQASLKDASS